MIQDTAIGALADAMLVRQKTGFLIYRAADHRALSRSLTHLPRLPAVDFALLTGSPANAEEAAETLIKRGCDLIVLWQTALSLQDFIEPGELVMPTRIVEAESGGRFDTGFPGMGRRDRAAILTTDFIEDPGARRRLAMRFQCVVMDTLSATLARRLARAKVPYLVVCAQIDRRAEYWTNRFFSWRVRFGSRTLLSALAWIWFKPRELMVFSTSRGGANASLRDAANLLRESLEEAFEDEFPSLPEEAG